MDFQDTFMIQNYLNITFDYGGVIYDPVLEDYVGYCPDDYFWLAPGCRDGNEDAVFPSFHLYRMVAGGDHAKGHRFWLHI